MFFLSRLMASRNSWLPISSTTSPLRTLFIPPAKISPAVAAYLSDLKISVEPYEAVWPFLEGLGHKLAASSSSTEGAVRTGQQVSWAVELALGPSKISKAVSPILLAKAIKNPVELDGMRKAYLRDGRATVRWIAQLKKMIHSGERVDEWEAAFVPPRDHLSPLSAPGSLTRDSSQRSAHPLPLQGGELRRTGVRQHQRVRSQRRAAALLARAGQVQARGPRCTLRE